MGYEIKPHGHPEEDIELMYIAGKTTFYRKQLNNQKEYVTESFTPRWSHVGRCFTVSAGVIHWFSVSNMPLVFINFATFKDGIKPKSASVDFAAE